MSAVNFCLVLTLGAPQFHCDLKNDPNVWFEVLLKQHLMNGPKGDGKLDLSFSAFGDQGLSQLASVLSISQLNLSHTKVTNKTIGKLRFMPRLEVLNLAHTIVSDNALPGLSMHSLKELDCSSSYIHGSGLSGFPKLVKLKMEDSALSSADLSSLRDLSDLEELDISGSRFPKKAGRFKNLVFPKIKSLDLSKITFIPSDESVLLTNKRLRHLTIDDTQVPSYIFDAIAELGDLEYLSLRRVGNLDAKMSGSILKLHSLRLLDLTGSDLSVAELKKLQSHLPDCEIANEKTNKGTTSK